nr:hypothetical protein [Escherichia coli]
MVAEKADPARVTADE